MKRNRFIYFILIIGTITLGMASRKYGYMLPELVSKYAGDVLWALMVYWGFGFLMNTKPIKKIFLLSLIFSFIIEISQVYQVDWINNIRNTTIGALILGHGFLLSDLICYFIGAILGVILESIFKRYFAKQENT